MGNIIEVQLVYDLKNDTFEITGNSINPREIVSKFLRTQIGADRTKEDNDLPIDRDKYTILIYLDLSNDKFLVSHDCGSKSLREGILSRFITCKSAKRNITSIYNVQ